MVSLFSARAGEHPDRPALVVVEPETGTVESATYGELAARAASIAGGLRRAGLCDQARVLLAGPLSVDFYALALALVGSEVSSSCSTARCRERDCCGRCGQLGWPRSSDRHSC